MFAVKIGRRCRMMIAAAACVGTLMIADGVSAQSQQAVYRSTLYNNFIAMAFNETCKVLTIKEADALLKNVNTIARDFRDLFGYDRQQWDSLIKELEERYETENLTCDNRRARSFTKSVARDITMLMQ